MSYSKIEIYKKLNELFVKHKRHYKNPENSKQLCCMWSVTNPPDIIEDTKPFHDIEKTLIVYSSSKILEATLFKTEENIIVILSLLAVITFLNGCVGFSG